MLKGRPVGATDRIQISITNAIAAFAADLEMDAETFIREYLRVETWRKYEEGKISTATDSISKACNRV